MNLPLHLTLTIIVMSDKEMEKVIIKTVEARKYLKSLTHLILQEQGLSLSVKEGQTNLFLYAGNYLRSMLANDYIALLYINHKIKKNATKP
jgi:hypothetical protein